jgi:hypothetical protein
MFKIPILYNRTKDIELFVQEEMYTVSINLNINCESQLQALEIQHRLLNYLPLNKFLQAYKYVSYFELDPVFLNNYLFDINNDRIDNLFLKHNKYTNTFAYCFSCEYEPLIRQDSCDVTIDPSSSSSFLVAGTYEFLTHIPVYIIGPRVNYENLVSKNELLYTNIAVPVNDNGKNILIQLLDTSSNITKQEISNNFEPSPSCVISGSFSTISLDYDMVTVFNDTKCEGLAHIIKDIASNNYINQRCLIEGERINGSLREIQDITPNVIRAYFDGFIYNKYVSQYLDFELHLFNSVNEISNLVTIVENPPFKIHSYKTLPLKNNILNSISNVNKSAVSINLNNTYITSIVLFDNSIIKFENVIFINPNTYEFVIDFYFNMDNKIINGSINPFNGDISVDCEMIKFIYMNVSLDLVKGIPASIDRINTNFNQLNEIISKTSPYETLKDSSGDYNIFITSDLNYNEELNQISFIVQNISLEHLSYKFIFNSTQIEPSQIIINNELSSPSLFVFNLANRFIYNRQLEHVDQANPLYFCYNHSI